MSKQARRTQEQKLRDAVAHASSCLKEADYPLLGRGPSARYAAAFDVYGKALKDLVQHTAGDLAHVADWAWDGYNGEWTFRWEFGFRAEQPGATGPHDARFVAMSCATRLDHEKLDEELTRLHAEAAHYDEMRGAMMRWASDTAKAAKASVKS